VVGDFDYYEVAYPIWRKKFSDRGFRVHYEEGYCWFPFSRSSNSLLIPHFLRLEKKLGLHKLASISPWIAFVAQKHS